MHSEEIGPEAGERLLEEAKETLRAIRDGSVDAFVVSEVDGHRVYALEGADLPYSALVERMQQGAAMLTADGRIIYCNSSLTAMLGISREAAVGVSLKDFLFPSDHKLCDTLLGRLRSGSSEGEMSLRSSDGSRIASNFSFKLLSHDQSTIGVLVTDLTERKQQIEIAARLQRMQDEERRRIARELHDSVGQLLVAIGMNLSAMQAQSKSLNPQIVRAVTENTDLVEQVSREIRTVSYLLHPPLLDEAGLVSALRMYVDGVTSRSKIKIDLQVTKDFPRLPDEMEIAVFRMIQEAVTNIHRHSGSATAVIGMQLRDDRLVVEVRDSGKGISKGKLGALGSGRSGVGLAGMRERLTQLRGKLEIESGEKGTTVRAILPAATLSR